MKKKLELIQRKSNFKRLNPEALIQLVGGAGNTYGNSCGRTGSSCGCDSTAVCNCPPPIKDKPIV
jgi:hypothetical protein